MTASAFAARFLSGRELYGDDFDDAGIAEWFADEQHGYAELYGSDAAQHAYGYTALNEHHGFSKLPAGRRYDHALGFGSNFGTELEPVLPLVSRVTLLDASDRYVVGRLKNVPVRYLLAEASGRIRLNDASVDLITCFGVLHHIPNVSTVVAEFARVLVPGGILMLREPTTSMGDWRRPRLGLTARERGIPRHILRSLVEGCGLGIVSATPCYFPPFVRLCEKLGKPTFGSSSTTAIDSALARASNWLYSYHRTNYLAKFAPASLFVIAEKPPAAGR